MNKIVLTADIIEFSDDFCRNLINSLDYKVTNLNKRLDTKTCEIRELNRRVKELEKELHK